MTVAAITAFVLLMTYMAVLGWLARGFLRTGQLPAAQLPQQPISLIICARNEEQHIVRCLHAVLAQHYSRNKLQLLLVNDASSDATVTLAQRMLQDSGVEYRIISNSHQKGKKQSIAAALQFAKHELVVLRDADTFTRSPLWLQSISDFQQLTGAGLLIGPVALCENEGLLWALQALENNVLALMSCGSAYYESAFLCNGANLAFTKATYARVNGFQSHQHLASGDDVFFLEDVRASRAATIRYFLSTDALVYTYPAPALLPLLRQKIRWASKFRHSSSRLNGGLAVLTFLVNALWLFAFCAALAWPTHSRAALSFVLVKLLFDILLLFLTARFIQSRRVWIYALPAALIYPAYACTVALGVLLAKPKWKS